MRNRTDSFSGGALNYRMRLARTQAKKISSPAAAAGVHRNNLLLAALPVAEVRGLIARCARVYLPFGAVLAEPGAKIRYVYFPMGSQISLISAIDQRRRLGVALIGTEGMLGIALLMGVNVEPLRALVQGPGFALRLEAARFSSELRKSTSLRQVLNRYSWVLMSQLAQMAVCASFHVLEARFARWLLMTRDRAHSNELHVTQQFIAQMLGVRRVGVTRAADALQKRKLICYTRGKLTILDNVGLEAVSCTCYAATEGAYTAVFASNGSPLDSRRGAR